MAAACSTSAETMRKSGFLALSAVSWALKSRSLVAKVWMSTMGMPVASSEAFMTSKPPLVKASSLP